MSNIKDVAKLANVSISTVSYALNNTGNVSDETKKKILDAAKKLDYRPSGIARSLKTKKTEIIGIFLNNFNGPIYGEIIRGVRDIAKSNGYEVVVAECMASKNTVTRLFGQKIVDGAIVLSADISDKIIKEYASKSFPIVTLDRELKGDFISSVLIDNKNAAYNAIKFIAEQGYKDILLINGPKGTYDSEKRYEGYQEGIKQYNLNLKDDWDCIGNFEEESGYRILKRVIESGNLPEVVCAANDEMAIGAIKALKEHNIKIPEDVAVIGFDDIPLCEYITPKLTTIRRPAYDLGVLATHTLFNNLKGNYDGRSKMLSTEFIIRETLVEREK
ncbi:LacI family DNA-binding transcriptional regulator [Clostridium sp. C8]|nr:LacI family DNA-binding transcriptional regulator [Clostridium sp. C8]KLE17190.1 LacI family transcriptional regulator [Clostridium sp. C8]